MPFDANGNWIETSDGSGGLSAGTNPTVADTSTSGTLPGNGTVAAPSTNSAFNLGNPFAGLGSGLDAGRMVAGVGGIASGLASGALIAPKVVQAGQQAATMADPFKGNNQQYIDRMNSLWNDPSQIADTPGYKFSLDQGLDAIGSKDNRQFGLGAGSTNADDIKFASGLASQTYQDQMKNLMQLSGANWNPSAGASDLMTGAMGGASLEQSGINQAIQGFSNLLAPNGTTTTNNNNGASSPTTSGWPKLPDGTPDYSKMTPAQFDRYLQSQGVTRTNDGGSNQNDTSNMGGAGDPTIATGDPNAGDIYRINEDFAPGDN